MLARCCTRSPARAQGPDAYFAPESVALDVYENAGQQARLKVQLSKASAFPLAVNYTVKPGTASTLDFSLPPGQLQFFGGRDQQGMYCVRAPIHHSGRSLDPA